MDDFTQTLRELVPDLDLSKDEHWLPVFNPYEGKITPIWRVTAHARLRIGTVDFDTIKIRKRQ